MMATFTPLLPITTVFPRRSSTVSVSSSASSNNITGLGQALLKATKVTGSNPPKTVNPKEKPKSKQVDNSKGKELTGSDILWALQKASAKKAQVKDNIGKKMVKNNGPGFGFKKGEDVVDYGKARPVIVKSDWVTRLDDLEKRLQEFNSV